MVTQKYGGNFGTIVHDEFPMPCGTQVLRTWATRSSSRANVMAILRCNRRRYNHMRQRGRRLLGPS